MNNLNVLRTGHFYKIIEWDETFETVKFVGLKGLCWDGYQATKNDRVIVEYPDKQQLLLPIKHFIKQIKTYLGPCVITGISWDDMLENP